MVGSSWVRMTLTHVWLVSGRAAHTQPTVGRGTRGRWNEESAASHTRLSVGRGVCASGGGGDEHPRLTSKNARTGGGGEVDEAPRRAWSMTIVAPFELLNGLMQRGGEQGAPMWRGTGKELRPSELLIGLRVRHHGYDVVGDGNRSEEERKEPLFVCNEWYGR